MKSKLKILSALLIVSAAIFLKQQTMNEHDGIVLNNIEALAAGEYPDHGCVGSGSVECPYTIIKVYYAFY